MGQEREKFIERGKAGKKEAGKGERCDGEKY
jgi:hypothetical protein